MFQFPHYAMAQFQTRWSQAATERICTSTLEPMALADILGGLSSAQQREWQGLALGYSSERGDLTLREIIAADYPGLSAENILIFSGAQEACFCAMYALLGADGLALRQRVPESSGNLLDQEVSAAQQLADNQSAIKAASIAFNTQSVNQKAISREPVAPAKVAAILPSFEPLLAIPQALGAEFVTTNLQPTEMGWQLPVDDLLNQLSDSHSLLIMNFPNNPTGALISREDQKRIIDKAASVGAWVFSDEVFRGLEHDAAAQLPPVASLYRHGVSMGSIAKPYGLGGVRIGWLACADQAMLARLITIKRSLSICAGRVDEWLACAVLSHKEALQAKNREYMQQQLAIVKTTLNSLGDQLQWIPPQAGIVAFPALRQHSNSEAYAEQLVQDTGVLLLPGSSFSGDFPQHFRLGFGLKSFSTGWARFVEHLIHYSS